MTIAKVQGIQAESVKEKRLLPLIAALACALAPAFAADSTPVKPVDAAGWSALALRDVEAMHTLLRDQTIVPFDRENPDYPSWLEEGYLAARTRGTQVTDAAGHFFTLRAYANGFQDPHFSVGGVTTAMRWPGFIAAEQGGKVIVVRSDPSDPAVPQPGAEIERCDGQTSSALVKQRLSPFLFSAGLPQRWSIPFLFQDMGNPLALLPVSCQVRTGDRVAEVALQWREMPRSSPSFAQDLLNAVSGPGAEWGVTEPAPGVFWVGVPTLRLRLRRNDHSQLTIIGGIAHGLRLRRSREQSQPTQGQSLIIAGFKGTSVGTETRR